MSDLILIIEDEPDLVRTLEYNLKQVGYQTRSANTGNGGIEAAQAVPAPALVLLDLMLPDIQGTEVCQHLRANPDTKNIPVIMLTARGEEEDKLAGFDLGADDYVTKPFSVAELISRIKAVLRRAKGGSDTLAKKQRFGLLTIDTEGHRVWIGEESVNLTSTEFKLLTTLASRIDRVQSREQLVDSVWGYTSGITDRTVDVHIKRLRGKIGEAGQYIDTVWGVGYRFHVPDDG